MTFQYEADFEEALIKVLSDKGWEKEVICNFFSFCCWRAIRWSNTRKYFPKAFCSSILSVTEYSNRLNNYPLTEGEMQQILEQINSLRTPIKLNTFINGKTGGSWYRVRRITAEPTLGRGIKQFGGTFATISGFA